MKRFLILLFLLIPAICFAGDWTIDLASPPAIGSTTPAAGTFSPTINKGPAAITTFAGTVSTSGSSTTITWSSAADAILAGYNATNPVLGTTVITGAIKQASVTRYIVSWTNATTCVVDLACTLAAATELTSVQLPVVTFVNSAGVTTGWINAAGETRFVAKVSFTSGNLILGSGGASNYIDTAANAPVFNGYSSVTIQSSAGSVKITPNGGNILINGIAAAGTSADKVLVMGSGTLPTAIVADAMQATVVDYNGAAGDARLHIMGEASAARKSVFGSGTVSIKGAAASGGGLTRQLAEATVTLSGASGSIAVNVPSGARILGVQLRVDTLITSGDGATSWTAAYVNTPTTAICSGKAFTANTKFDALHPAYEITTGTVTITITPNANTFSGGVVRGIVYFEALDTMASL